METSDPTVAPLPNATEQGVVGNTSADPFTTENHIWIYTAPIILIFGIIGNILTIIVMSQQRMRGTSTSVYLTLLAVGDVTVIVVGLTPEWLSQLHLVDLWDLHPWVCKVELFLYYSALDFAIWVLVAFCIDRFIAVTFPLKKREYCTQRRASIVVLIIFGLTGLNAHVFWTRGAVYVNGTLLGNCMYVEPYVSFELYVRPILVLLAAFVVPFLVLAVCNTVIVIKMMSAQALRKASVTASVRHRHAQQRQRSAFTQTAAMCVSTSVAFLVLVLPNIVLLIGKKWWAVPDNTAFWHAKAVAAQLVYINHSINFVLYSLTGSRFRTELAVLCRCRNASVFFSRLFNITSSSSSSSERHSQKFSFTRYSRSHVDSPKLGHSEYRRSPAMRDKGLPLNVITEAKNKSHFYD